MLPPEEPLNLESLRLGRSDNDTAVSPLPAAPNFLYLNYFTLSCRLRRLVGLYRDIFQSKSSIGSGYKDVSFSGRDAA